METEEKKELKPILSNQVRIGLISILVIGIYFWYYGFLPWAVQYAICGQKPNVQAAGLFGMNPHGKVYTPSMVGYGPMSFSKYTCPSR